ncbi:MULTISPECIES: hypothetical protein [unclassified Streptomyces]|uniref:hypothetical protein n=1 Tax=Streptomyces sp. T21Q-yed TaxID=3018441 RepID=UPI0023654064|nr:MULTISPECIES: hypothetical protein [unclassified Streptomyces]MDF3144543.1 hypothetical protein [Streptomyces sp. T21Q-yed]WDF40699.1 hypothetical protein PBV52_29910 [Streptomyces sp. T12]
MQSIIVVRMGSSGPDGQPRLPGGRLLRLGLFGDPTGPAFALDRAKKESLVSLALRFDRIREDVLCVLAVAESEVVR